MVGARDTANEFTHSFGHILPCHVLSVCRAAEPCRCCGVLVVLLPQTHLRDFAVWLVAFFATLFLGIELGLAAAIGLALLIVVFESAFPHTAVLGRVDRTTVSVPAMPRKSAFCCRLRNC